MIIIYHRESTHFFSNKDNRISWRKKTGAHFSCIFTYNTTYRVVTKLFIYSWSASCRIANSHARWGAISQVAPRHLLLPQKRRKRARARFNTKNTHEVPARVIVVVVCDSPIPMPCGWWWWWWWRHCKVDWNKSWETKSLH